MSGILRVDRLAFVRGGRLIIDDVDCTAPSGSVTALVGPNGAGKSTLLHLIARLEKPARGRVRLDDHDLHHLDRRGLARHVAFVDQSPETDLALRVDDVVALGRFARMPRFAAPGPADREIAAACLDRVRAAHLAHRRLSELSGGERQLVMLARALAQGPSLLLLDEPTNHLDVRAQLRSLALLAELAGQGLTIVAALHDLNLAAAYAGHVIVLREGRVLASGPAPQTLSPTVLSAAYDVDVGVVRDGGPTSFTFSLPRSDRDA